LINIIIRFVFIFIFRTGVSKCQDFRSPFGALADCGNQTHINCSDEQRLLYFLMKYKIKIFENVFCLVFLFFLIYRNYSNSVRPVRNASIPVPVKLGLTLTQIFDMVSIREV
jgi:hypothetical protein